jgi:hypothetical protein
MSRMARQSERVRLEMGEGRDQRAHSCGDPHGRVQDVVDHQRRRGEQARVRAQVLRSNRVASPAVGVGVDRLQVREEDDGQQANDREADGNDALNPCEAEGDEKCQRGFGTIRSRAKGIKTEDGNAGDRTDVLRTLFRGCERLADDNVEE